MTSSNWSKFRNLSGLRPLISRLYLLLVAIAIFLSVTRHHELVVEVIQQLDTSFLISSFLCCISALLLQALTWQKIQKALAPGLHIPQSEWLFAYIYGYLGRYVPGKVAMLVGRTLLLSRHGYSKRAVVGAAAIENGVFFLGTIALSIFCLPQILHSLNFDSLPILDSFLLKSIFTLLGTLAMIWGFHSALNLAARFARVHTHSVAWITSLQVLGLAILYQFLNGLSFYFLIIPFANSEELSFSIYLQVSAALSLGIGLGILALIAPGGLGVREVVLTALLAGVINSHSAYILPLVLRFVMLVAEVSLCGSCALYRRATNRPAATENNQTL